MRRIRVTPLITLLAAAPALAEPEYGRLAEELARLRGEIAALDQRLSDQQDEKRSQLRALSAQRSALELDLQREELRHRQLAERRARHEQRSGAQAGRQRALNGVVAAAARALSAPLTAGIPLQVEERLGALSEIVRAAEEGSAPPQVLLERLWTWIDEETKLARESSIEKRALVLDGQEVLADVARIGMVALYFRAPDGRHGFARREGGAWRWQLATGPEQAQGIEQLFAALQAGPVRGFFRLPGEALAVTEAAR